MSVLLETTLGDMVVDLDMEGSPELCRNFLKLCKARYYTSTLVYNVEPTRYCQLGDPQGNGRGGACVFGLMEEQQDNHSLLKSKHRFMKSKGRILSRTEKQERGRVVAVEMNGIPDTIGSQFLITLDEGEDKALDGIMMEDGAAVHPAQFLSLGTVVEDDDNVLTKIQSAYCDADGRPYADVRILRALIIHDPFEDPDGMDELLKRRGVVVVEGGKVTDSPNYERPPEEVVEHRIQAISQMDDLQDEEETLERARAREEEIQQRETKSRAVVLEMLGDLPSADIKAPENVLFVCKLNSVTEDDDLELIFSRFDPNVKAEIIRDPVTGDSLQYAFVEFSTKQQCVEAYFKMNNALIDDRRIKVDFSQSVAKVWDRYNQKRRMPRNVNIERKEGSGGGRQHGRGGGRGGGERRERGGGGGGGGQHGRQARPSAREEYREDHRQSRTRPHDTHEQHGDDRNGSRWGPPRTSEEQRRGGGGGRNHHQHDGNHGRRDEYGRIIPDNAAGGRRGKEDSGGGRGRYGDDGDHRRDRRHRHDDDPRQYDRHENRRHDSDEGDYKQRRDFDHNDRGGSRERSSRDHPRRSRTTSDDRQRGRRSRSYSSDSSAGSDRRRSDGGGSTTTSSVSDDASRKRKKHSRHHRHKRNHKRSRKHHGRRHDDDDSDSDGGRDRHHHHHHRRHKKKKHRKEHKRKPRHNDDDHNDREHKRRKHHKSSRSGSPPSQDQQE